MILLSVFSAFIILMIVVNILKVVRIAYKRNEMSYQKSFWISTATIVIGIFVASVLPFIYQKLFSFIL